jgi:hypothetical protein
MGYFTSKLLFVVSLSLSLALAPFTYRQSVSQTNTLHHENAVRQFEQELLFGIWAGPFEIPIIRAHSRKNSLEMLMIGNKSICGSCLHVLTNLS